MISSALDIVVIVLMALGTLLTMIGAVGVVRMPDPYTRAQASTKAATLGLTLIFLAVAIDLGDLASVSEAVTVVLFAFLSIPIGAHMIIRATHTAGTPIGDDDATDDLREARQDEGATPRRG